MSTIITIVMAIIKILLKGNTSWGATCQPPESIAGAFTEVKSPKTVRANCINTRLTPHVANKLFNGLPYSLRIINRSIIKPKTPEIRKDIGIENQKKASTYSHNLWSPENVQKW